MKKFKLLIISGLLALLVLAPAVIQAEFSDLSSENLNHEAINYLQTNNIVEGYPDGQFKAQNRINRAEMLKILVEAKYDQEAINSCISQNTSNNASTVFYPDVPTSEWFAKYVCLATKEGIVSGYPDGTFKPAEHINFAEISKIIVNALGLEAQPADGEWYSGFVKTLEAEKAIPTSVFFFDENITRGEMSEMVWRIMTDNTSKQSLTFNQLSADLPTFSSCEALKESFAVQNSNQNTLTVNQRTTNAPSEESGAADSMATSEAGSGSSDGDFSTTNVQVEGVDEADVIKNDGQYIYLIKGDTIRIVQAVPSNQMKQVASIQLDAETDFLPQEMYLNGDQLVVIGHEGQNYGEVQPFSGDEMMRIAPGFFQQKSRVFTLDVADRSNPRITRDFNVDGQYLTSRRVNNSLYLVLNNPQYYYGYGEPGLPVPLPQFREGQAATQNLADCNQIRYLPGHGNPSYIILLGIDLANDNSTIDRQVVLGSTDNVYASKDNLYIAQTDYGYNFYTDWDWSRDYLKTHIFKFNLSNADLTFQARSSVAGRIINQFSMDEHNSNFRIATTTGNNWETNTPQSNNVTVLNSQLQKIGELTGIAPGEDIYSARFMQNRLYMVTFQTIDPFFVIDLATPTQPRILGELKIPGFSNYLHPFDENHIIGFGKEATEDVSGDFAWFQGMKIALFDVTNPANPQLVHSETIGDRGTSSELLHNHKALLFDPASGLLAFPVERFEIENKSTLKPEDQPFAYGKRVFQGAYIYNLTRANGFNLLGTVTHYDALDSTNEGLLYNINKEISRIIRIGNVLYPVSQGVLSAIDRTTTNKLNQIQLP